MSDNVTSMMRTPQNLKGLSGLDDLYQLKKDSIAGHKKRIVPTIETYRLIGFKLNNEEFGVEIERVKEIVRVPLVTRVSKAPDFVEGVANLRGDILQIINLHKIMGLENSPISEKSRIIAIDDKNVFGAIIVDAVSEVIEVEKEAVQTTPDIIASEKSKFLKGIIKAHKHRNILWLDSGAIYFEFNAQHEKSAA